MPCFLCSHFHSPQQALQVRSPAASHDQPSPIAECQGQRSSGAPTFVPFSRSNAHAIRELTVVSFAVRGKSRAKPAPRTAVWRSSLVARAIGISVAHARAPGGWKKLGGGHLIKAMVDFDNNMRISKPCSHALPIPFSWCLCSRCHLVAIPYNGRGALTFDATVDSLETTITDRAIFREGGIFVVTLRERAGLMRYMLQVSVRASIEDDPRLITVCSTR